MGAVPGPPEKPRKSFGQRVYDFLFRFLGPAQLGRPDEPPPPVVDPSTTTCPRCGRPMTEHTYVETAQRRRLRCPV
jgi:hypothetical protein